MAFICNKSFIYFVLLLKIIILTSSTTLKEVKKRRMTEEKEKSVQMGHIVNWRIMCENLPKKAKSKLKNHVWPKWGKIPEHKGD